MKNSLREEIERLNIERGVLKAKLGITEEYLQKLNKKTEDERIVEGFCTLDITMEIKEEIIPKESLCMISKGYGVVPTPKMYLQAVYTRKGSKMVCTLIDIEKKEVVIVGKGVSRCHWEDDFDYDIAFKLSGVRAWEDFYKRQAEDILKEI